MKKKIAIAGVIIFLALLFAAMTLPARVAWQLAQSKIPAMQLSGLHGTFWRGQSDTVMIANQALGKLSWDIPALSLLSLAPRARVKLDGSSAKLEGWVRQAGTELVLSGFSASADAIWLAPALGIPAVIPTGSLSVNLSEAAFDRRGLPLRAQGNLQWLGAGVTGLAQADFGSYDIALHTDASGAIVGVVQPIGQGALDISGGFSLRGENFVAEITLREIVANPNIERALALIGEPIAGTPGARLLKIRGTLLLPK